MRERRRADAEVLRCRDKLNENWLQSRIQTSRTRYVSLRLCLSIDTTGLCVLRCVPLRACVSVAVSLWACCVERVHLHLFILPSDHSVARTKGKKLAQRI